MKAKKCLTPWLLVASGLWLLAPLTRAQPVVTIHATDDVAAETLPGEPPNTGSIRLSRSGSTASALTVWLRVRGTAVPGVDYAFANPVGSFVTIPAGRASLDLSILPRDDAFTEATENVRIDLQDETSAGAPVPYALGNDRAEVSLLDNEDPNLPPRAVVSVTQFGSQALEAFSNPVTFRITREGNLAVPIQVRYTLGGSATVGEDYAALAETIALAANVTFAEVNLVAINDPLVEGPETVTFTLAPHPNIGDAPPPDDAYALGFTTTASVTIISEDLPPPPVVTITSPVNGGTQPAPGTIHVAFNAVDPNGYIARFALFHGSTLLASNNLSHPVPPGPGTPFDFSITLTNLRAGLHAFRARAWGNSGVAGASASVQSIVTNIPPVYPKMSVAAVDAEAAEGLVDGQPDSAVFAITVDRPMPSDQYVVYRLSSPGPGDDFGFPGNYSATNWPMFWPVGPTDYGYAYFPSGSTRVEIVVTPVDDAINEGAETLTLTLSHPFVFTEQTFEGIVQFTEGGFHTPPFDPFALPPRYFDYDLTTNNTATAVILDNDTGPTPFAIVSITATDADAEETPDGVAPNAGVFTISRVGPTNLPLMVNYQFTTRPRDIPLRFPIPVQAIHGVDFVALPHPGTAVIPAGATSTEIVITPINDLVSEIAEYAQIHLRPSLIPIPDASSYLLYTNSSASLVIRDLALPAFTPIVRIKTLDGQAIEQNAVSPHAVFQVERQGSVAEALTVPYTISGTAGNGLDYARLPGFVSFPVGGRFVNLTIIPYLDGETNEPDETVVITLQPPPAGVFPPPYVLGSTGARIASAGATIREDAPPRGPIDRFERARRLRFPSRYRIVPLPVLPTNAPAAPAPMIWAVEASSDFVAWEELGETEDPEEFLDVNAGDASQRFYRFREVPPVEP
jgi:hypothetical protein